MQCHSDHHTCKYYTDTIRSPASRGLNCGLGIRHKWST